MSRFVDEALDELVRVSREALELAGHHLIEPMVEYPLPAAPGVSERPAILGDIQSRRSDGTLSAYYGRTANVEVLIPEWLSSMVRESHQLQNMPTVYVIVDADISEDDRRDAEACGAGVLRIDANRRLTELVPVGAPSDEMTDQEFDAAVESLRSDVVTASSLNQGRILAEYNQVTVAGPVSQQRQQRLMDEHSDWSDWRGRRTREVDQLKRSKSRRRLAELTEEIRIDLVPPQN